MSAPLNSNGCGSVVPPFRTEIGKPCDLDSLNAMTVSKALRIVTRQICLVLLFALPTIAFSKMC